MRWLRRVIGGANALVRSQRVEGELDEELRAYLETAVGEKMRGGMGREEATRAARLETGLVSMDNVKERVRDVGWEVWIETLWQDLCFAVRMLAKDRGFTIAAVVALGLAIGLNTSVFAIVNAAFLRDVPLDEPERLLAIQLRDSRAPQPRRDIGGLSPGGPIVAVSYADLREWREQTASFEGLAANAPGAMNLSDDGAPAERFRGSYLTANTFRVLRVAPILGRDFVDGDDDPGAPGVLMLGYGVWQSRYARDPSVIGRTVRINDVPATIIGVMPKRFNYPAVDQMWQAISSSPNFARETRSTRNLSVVGRLKPGVDLTRARAELDGVVARLADTFPEAYKQLAIFARPLRELYPTPPVQMIATMMGAVGFVLLIAYANLANLLLARSIRRSREVAIRLALGSSRLRVIRQFLLECLLIALAGGAVGFGLSLYGVREIAVAFEPIEAGVRLGSNRPFWVDISPNAILYAFVGLLSIASAFAFGLLPAWQMWKTDLNATLNAESRSGGGSRRGRRWTSALLVAELALALVLLSGAGLLWRDFIERYREDTVIDASGVVAMRLALPPQKYSTSADRKRFLEQLNRRLSEMTVFSAVTMASHVPMDFGAPIREVFVEGTDHAPGEKPPLISYLLTGARYFETLKLPIVRGRGFHDMDARPGQEGAVVDERFATRFFPNKDPVRRRIRVGARGVWYTIVGIARTVAQNGPASELRPIVYAPLEAEPAPDGRAAIIVKGPLAAAVATLRTEVRAMDSELPLFAIETLEQTRARGRIPARLFSTWFGSLAIVALLLASVGVFAITTHSVAQRAEEIGIRMALGADARNVVRMFMHRTLVLLALAMVLGLAGSLALGTLIQSLLQQVGQRDSLTLTIVSVILGSVTLLATWLPARRAARVDPAVALRAEYAAR
jgi:putative ABC transport system permease protein